MTEILSSRWFHVVLAPLILVLMGALAARLGRRSNDNAPEKNDWAISTMILLTTLGSVFADLLTYQNRASSLLLGWLVIVFFFLFLSIENDRFRSWEKTQSGTPRNEKKLFMGVVIPDVLSLVILGAYRHSIWSLHQ